MHEYAHSKRYNAGYYPKRVEYLKVSLHRRPQTWQKQLEYKYLDTKMYTNTLFSSKPLVIRNECAQLFVTSEGFVNSEPMKSKGDAYLVEKYMLLTWVTIHIGFR